MLREKKKLVTLCVYFAIFFAAVLAQNCLKINEFNEEFETNLDVNKLDKIRDACYKAKNNNNYFIEAKIELNMGTEKTNEAYISLEYPEVSANGIKKALKLVTDKQIQNLANFYGCVKYPFSDLEFFFIEYLPNNFGTREFYEYENMKNMEKSKADKNVKFHEKFLKLSLKEKLRIYYEIALSLESIHIKDLYYLDFDPSQIFFSDNENWEPKLLNFMNVRCKKENYSKKGKISIFDDKHLLRYRLSKTDSEAEKKALERKKKWKANIWAFGMLIYVLHNSEKKLINFAFDPFEFKDIESNLKTVINKIVKEDWEDKEIMSLKLKDPSSVKKKLFLNTKPEIENFKDLIENMMKYNRDDMTLKAEKIEGILKIFYEECPGEGKKSDIL